MQMEIMRILLLTQLCLGAEMTEAMKGEVTEKLHKGTPNLLLNLGDTLKEGLLHPTEDKNHGQDIIEDLYKYYHNLNDVYQMVISKGDCEKKLGMKLFRMLLEAGGPPHINIEFDIEDAMVKFQWNNRAVQNVRQVIDDTEIIWEKMQIESEKPENGILL